MTIARPLLPPPAPPTLYADEELPVHDDADAALKVEVEEASTVEKKEVGLAYVAAITLKEEDVKPFRADPFHLQRVGGRPRSPSASPPPRRSIGDLVKGRPRTPVNYRLARPYHKR